jgi:hypothetical protein
VWSSLISAYVLHDSKDVENSVYTGDTEPICGAFYCPIDGTNSTIRPLVTSDRVKVGTGLC